MIFDPKCSLNIFLFGRLFQTKIIAANELKTGQKVGFDKNAPIKIVPVGIKQDFSIALQI